MQSRAFREGSALITCIIFLVVFMALAVGMATMSGANLRMSDNQREANSAFASAESGLEVVRYWVDRVRIPSSTAVEDYLSAAISHLQAELAADGIENLHINSDGSIPTAVVHALAGQSFSGQLSVDPGNPAVLRLLIVGNSHEAARTLRVGFDIKPYKWPIFDYGLATKGPIRFPGNPTITAVNANDEADIYIESKNSLLALQVNGNTNFDGDIEVGYPGRSVYFDGDVQIAGDHDEQAIDQHVYIPTEEPEEPLEFPYPDTDKFRTYATGLTITAATDTNDNMTLTNARILAGANKTFEGNVVIQGILFIEQPNTLAFNGNVQLEGIIVGDGDPLNPGTNSIIFSGNFASTTFPSGPQFDAIRSEQGSSFLAPGFAVEMAGNFSSMGGVMAVTGFYLSGNASALVKGTLIDYSENPIVFEGNASLNFDRSAMVEIPAGFDLFRVLTYDPASYTVVF